MYSTSKRHDYSHHDYCFVFKNLYNTSTKFVNQTVCGRFDQLICIVIVVVVDYQTVIFIDTIFRKIQQTLCMHIQCINNIFIFYLQNSLYSFDQFTQRAFLASIYVVCVILHIPLLQFSFVSVDPRLHRTFHLTVNWPFYLATSDITFSHK